MIELLQWARTSGLPERPWLILGKGPTFSRRGDFDLAQYNLLALNHVVRELEVDVAHAIDIEVIRDCADALLTNARWLVMPRRPHVDLLPSDRLLEDHVPDEPVLRALQEAGRLVWYNLATTAPVEGSPVVGASWFSAEAAIGLLAAAGVKRIRSLGVDGGKRYSGVFGDLEGRTRLAGGQDSFDRQFEGIRRIVAENRIDYAPLVEPVRVFVGCDETQLVPARVLEHSIRKQAGRPVEFTAMADLPVPIPKDPENRPRTGFSFYRFMIPELCGYQGRALYLDADMQVFADISELWEIPFGEATVLCTTQPEPPAVWRNDPSFKPGRHLAVMLLDCSRLRWDLTEIIDGLDKTRYTYQELMNDLSIVPDEQIAETIPADWNSLERYEGGRTRLIHYTHVPTQPWKVDTNPLGELWRAGFRNALEDGALPPALVARGIARGYLAPSLAAELKRTKWAGRRLRARLAAASGERRVRAAAGRLVTGA